MYAAPTGGPLGGWLRWVCGRDESLPYGVKMKGMQWQACGPGMPGPYRVVVGELGGIGKVRGRHVRRPLRGGGGFVSDIGWAILTKLYRILTGFPLM